MVAISVIQFSAVAVVLGFAFQSILPGNIRMLIYPLSFMLGLITGMFSFYYLLAFNLGMISKAAVGRYWHCVFLEVMLLSLGLMIGIFVM